MKFFLPVLLFISADLFSQSADFIQLKKNNKVITTYFSGSEISFTTEDGAFINAVITGIKNDTLYLQEFITQNIPVSMSAYRIDTINTYNYKYHYNQIAAIGKKERTNFNMKGSGAALFGGGVLLTVASGVVYVADPEKFSLPLLLASVGLGTIGYFLATGKKHGSGMAIGEKYKLVYMDMSNKKG
jgi:hypothetical protein